MSSLPEHRADATVTADFLNTDVSCKDVPHDVCMIFQRRDHVCFGIKATAAVPKDKSPSITFKIGQQVSLLHVTLKRDPASPQGQLITNGRGAWMLESKGETESQDAPTSISGTIYHALNGEIAFEDSTTKSVWVLTG